MCNIYDLRMCVLKLDSLLAFNAMQIAHKSMQSIKTHAKFTQSILKDDDDDCWTDSIHL